jgi:hypothetical protein
MHPELRKNVYDMLVLRGWEPLPIEADRLKLPGFIPTWPRGEDFETLNTAFAQANPETQFNSDDISLMVVWLSVRLPYKVENEDEQKDESSEVEPAT